MLPVIQVHVFTQQSPKIIVFKACGLFCKVLDLNQNFRYNELKLFFVNVNKLLCQLNIFAKPSLKNKTFSSTSYYRGMTCEQRNRNMQTMLIQEYQHVFSLYSSFMIWKFSRITLHRSSATSTLLVFISFCFPYAINHVQWYKQTATYK